MAHTMLVEASLPRHYWFWALRESVIRMNLLPCKPTGKWGSPQVPPSDSSPNSSKKNQVPPSDSSPNSSKKPQVPPSNSSPNSSKDPSKEVAQPASTQSRKSTRTRARPGNPTLTTPFELFYGEKPDYHVLFKWGSVGYYRRDSDSGVKRGNFNMQTNVGISLGRSNQINAMIFWDPGTSRMNVSAKYRLDPTASITTQYPALIYDGHILVPWFFEGGKNSDKEPFLPGSKVTVLQDDAHLPGTVVSVTVSDEGEYTILLEDSPQPYTVPLEMSTGEGEPILHMVSIEPSSNPTAALPRVLDWIQENTYVMIHHDGRKRRGMLQSTDNGWNFVQTTTSGRTTFTLDLADLPVSWEERLTEGSLELGWQAQARAYHVSAKGITMGIPQSFRKSIEMGYPDRRLWMESYVEEAMGLPEQDTYVIISAKEYEQCYSNIQIIPTMNVQTLKKDEVGALDRVKSRIVACPGKCLGTHLGEK
jgi:hypothetical protein